MGQTIFCMLFLQDFLWRKITREIRRVSEAENLLKDLGFYQFRVRSHGDLARIEVLPEEMNKFLSMVCVIK